MKTHALNRVNKGLPMPGVFAVPQSLAIGKAIDDIILIADCSSDEEWEGQVRFLPL
jgi:hypothetical protein